MKQDKQDRFTLDEYLKYQSQEQWQKDDTDDIFSSESDYEGYWCAQIKTWKKQYDEAFKGTTTQWADAINYIESGPKTYSLASLVSDREVAEQQIPYALCSIMELIALLYSNYPEPIYISPGQQQDIYSHALQQMAQITLKANSFNELMFDLGVDIGYAGLGVLKTYVDYDQVGPYGDKGKIIIQKIDPLKVAFDPKCTRLKWSDMRYIIVTDTVDLGTARRLYPEGRSKLKGLAKTEQSDDSVHDGQFGDQLISPVPSPTQGNSTQRAQITLREAWFQDDREMFVADMEPVVNHKAVIDDGGNPQENPDYDPDEPEIYTRPALDENGFVRGSWQPAYPYGRCIVTANDKVIVADFGNPFWHKRAPFTFYRGRPSRRPITTGDLTNIINIDRKMNDLLSRVHTMCQAEIERPIIAEVRTFKTPRAWMKMSGMSSAVLQKNPNTEFARMAPTEIPQFIWAQLQELKGAMDKVMAVAGVMRGDLTEGSQLSAEAVSSLQGMASTMLKMKAEFIAEGMKELGYQIMWLIREIYPENIDIPVTKPDGTTTTIKFNDADLADDYIVGIESGSGLPGSQQASIATVLPMFTNRLISRRKALQMLKFSDADQVDKELKDERLQQIESAAAGKAVGVNIKEFEKDQSSAGRTSKV